MIDLFKQFSLQQIIIFVVLLALAIKGIISFVDWVKDRNKKAGEQAQKPAQLEKDLKEHEQDIKELKEAISNLTDKVDLLINSDKDSIKAYITQKHHYYCYEKGWIDDYSLDCIEKRYSHYQEYDGNSFVKSLMVELRELPRQSEK